LISQARRFADALVVRHAASRQVVEQAFEQAVESNQSFPEFIGQVLELAPADIAAGWAAALGVHHVDFSAEVLSPEAGNMLEEDLSQLFMAVPVRVDEQGLLVAFPMPLDPKAVKQVADHLQLTGGPDLVVGISDPESLADAWNVVYGRGSTQTQHGDGAINELYRLFDRVVEMGASDLHLAADEPPFVRVVGDLMRMPDEPVISAARVRELVYSILSNRQQKRFEETSELDTSHAMRSKIRFRVNVFVQRNAVGAAFRVIPFDVVDFDHLGVPEVIKTWADLPRGLVLVTGPTGSGKSTTLASLIDIVNRTRPVHVMTIEDPVEFVHHSKVALVNQREVGEDTAAFGTALTQAMRQDPDVILVGEMRDLETISTAITAAETGHLVFGTLHTQDAAQTVDRIIDVFPGEQQAQVRIQLANSLVGVSTQQLVPTADGRGRAVACEVMIANTAIRSLIRDGKVHQIHNAMASGKRVGMQSMDESLAGLVRRGIVAADQAMRRAKNADDLARSLGMTPEA
jgi:twitching motility protein PilT